MSTLPITRPRKPPSYEGPQQCARVPPWRPGQWVKIRAFVPGSDLAGRVVQVKSLTASLSSPTQRYVVWRVHVEPDGRCVLASHVERHATIAERQRAERNGGGAR